MAALSLLGGCGGVPLFGNFGKSQKAGAASAVKAVNLQAQQTGETLNVVFRHGRTYDQQALRAIDYFLRDRNVDMMIAMDANLLELIHDLHATLKTNQPLTVLSAYRTPQTNRRLRRRGLGAVRNSLHVRGMALDFRVAGVPTRALRDAAKTLNRGGVGYYPRQNFVHVDTGRPRYWVS